MLLRNAHISSKKKKKSENIFTERESLGKDSTGRKSR